MHRDYESVSSMKVNPEILKVGRLFEYSSDLHKGEASNAMDSVEIDGEENRRLYLE